MKHFGESINCLLGPQILTCPSSEALANIPKHTGFQSTDVTGFE
jgi:hypothetical protein